LTGPGDRPFCTAAGSSFFWYNQNLAASASDFSIRLKVARRKLHPQGNRIIGS
jgi:hypothetical protein